MLKCFAWIFALYILATDLVLLLAVIVGTFAISILIQPGFFLVFVIYVGVIRKRYRQIFPESRFLTSNKLLVLFVLIISLTVQLLIVLALTF